MTTLLAPQDNLFQILNDSMRRYRDELMSFGTLAEATSSTQLRGLCLSAGCEAGGKEGNQDYVATFVPQQPHNFRWGVAVSDGVTGSPYSELGSELACLSSLLALHRIYHPKPTKKRPVTTCLSHFRTLGELIKKQPDDYRPHSSSRFGWKFALREGKLLQTTLMVAWEDVQGLHVEGIGDGGFILETEPGNPPLSYLPNSGTPVRCLGPNNAQLRGDYRFNFTRWQSLCLFTDGLTHLVPRWYPKLGEALQAPGSGGPAFAVLNDIIQNDRHLLNDNVSLASICKEQP